MFKKEKPKIRISKALKDKLDSVGQKNESYEKVIIRFLPKNFVKSFWENKK